eukprot:2730078-Pleurochrysis_carterae.AAC.1
MACEHSFAGKEKARQPEITGEALVFLYQLKRARKPKQEYKRGSTLASSSVIPKGSSERGDMGRYGEI